jgi:hypothetical protein
MNSLILRPDQDPAPDPEELPLNDPPTPEDEWETMRVQKTLKQAQSLTSRAIFAWVVTTIFFGGLLGSTWPLAAMLTTVTLVLVILSVKLDVWVSFWNTVLMRPFLRTNNRWAGWMWVFVVISLFALLFVPMGSGRTRETSQAHAVALDKQTVDLAAERMNNLNKYGRYETNEECRTGCGRVGATPATAAATGPVPPTPSVTVSSDPVRANWWIHVGCLLALLILAIIYTLFFAPADEGRNFARWMENKVKEKAEGITPERVAETAARMAPAVMGAATKGGSSFAREAARSLSWDVVYDFISSPFKKLWRAR